MKRIFLIVLLVLAIAIVIEAGENEKYPRSNFGACGNCQETDMTLSGPGILEKEVRIFHCEKTDTSSFFKVDIRKGRTLIFIVNQERTALEDDQPVLDEVVKFIEETDNGSNERVWNRVNLVVK